MTLEAENKALLETNARLRGENDALATMLKDERRAVRDLQIRIVSLEFEVKAGTDENHVLEEQIESLKADLEKAREGGEVMDLDLVDLEYEVNEAVSRYRRLYRGELEGQPSFEVEQRKKINEAPRISLKKLDFILEWLIFLGGEGDRLTFRKLVGEFEQFSKEHIDKSGRLTLYHYSELDLGVNGAWYAFFMENCKLLKNKKFDMEHRSELFLNCLQETRWWLYKKSGQAN